MSKYKYYFRKPKSEIVKDIFKWLTIAGAVTITASSPYLIFNIMKAFERERRYPKNKAYNAFYKLWKGGYLEIGKRNHQIFIALTEVGRKKAGRFQIDSLEIKKLKRWDRKWRLVIFDISELKKLYREAFRGKLKELGFYPLQKSIWVHPFPCYDEVELLKDFFGLSLRELRIITAGDIGDDTFLKKIFKLK